MRLPAVVELDPPQRGFSQRASLASLLVGHPWRRVPRPEYSPVAAVQLAHFRPPRRFRRSSHSSIAPRINSALAAFSSSAAIANRRCTAGGRATVVTTL